MNYKVVTVTIPKGREQERQEVKVEDGTIIACALHTDHVPSSMVKIKLEDTNLNEIHPFVSYKEFQPTNGNHFESRKHLNVDGNRDVVVFAKTSKPLQKAFSFDLLFYVEKPQS